MKADDVNPIADKNVERLLATAYQPEMPDEAFVQRVGAAMHAAAREQTVPAVTRKRRPLRWMIAWAVAGSALLFLGAIGGAYLAGPGFLREGPLVWIDGTAYVEADATASGQEAEAAGPESALPDAGETPAPQQTRVPQAAGLTARAVEKAAPPERLVVGQSLQTGDQRRRVALDDGSMLYINRHTSISADRSREVTLHRGEVFVEVSPRKPDSAGPTPARFTVNTPGRQVVALGTKFDVRVENEATEVLVAQGKVQVTGMKLPLLAGQQLAFTGRDEGETPAMSRPPRATHALDWTRDLVAAAQSPLVPGSKYCGGALVAVDPNGQETKLSLRKYHVDVHIEDGFARTTIDQTYFNHEPSRLGGTFYFPLPADASLSRLAMYVEGRLMEGGMAERDYARQVFESIVYRQKDPALLEWIDGSTFKMRVFPLEGRQEKRIILSYTQRLPSLYGRAGYRFPGGHNLPQIGQWSAHVFVKNGAELQWNSDSHQFQTTKDKNDLLLDASAKNVKPDRDIVLTLHSPTSPLSTSPLSTSPHPHSPLSTSPLSTSPPLPSPHPHITSATHEGSRYLALRWRPELPAETNRHRRDWVFLFESSAERDPLLARCQVEIIKTILENAEHDDTFAILAAGTRVQVTAKRQEATAENIGRAIKALEQTHLIGALDLERALAAATPYVMAGKEPVLVHLGSAVTIFGQRDVDALVKRLPERARYVGIGVGKRWDRTFMKTAAARTGGYFTQINPDEQVKWRAMDLLATLNTPRLLNVRVCRVGRGTSPTSPVADKGDGGTRPSSHPTDFLCAEDSLAEGEELCAIARFDADEKLPEMVEVSGMLEGKLRRWTLPVSEAAAGADYLPRTWARLEIDRLVADGAEKNKARIIELSKAMYVMSPFTSLLVLENEEMYAQYKVDRGRKDHWAMYPCPGRIPVVHEPLPRVAQVPLREPAAKKPSVEQVLQTLLVRRSPQVLAWPGQPSLPTFSFVTVTTPVSVPDGGTVLLGGIRRLSEGRYRWGEPILDGVPYQNGIFGRTAIGRETASLMMMVTPRIIIQEEEEERLGIGPFDGGWHYVPGDPGDVSVVGWQQMGPSTAMSLLPSLGAGQTHRFTGIPQVDATEISAWGDFWEPAFYTWNGQSPAAASALRWLAEHQRGDAQWKLDGFHLAEQYGVKVYPLADLVLPIRDSATQQRLANIVDEYNRCLDEHRFAEAEVLAKKALELDPREPVSQLLVNQSKVMRSLDLQRSSRHGRDQGVRDVLGSVDQASVPVDETAPIHFPDAADWRSLSQGRSSLGEIGTLYQLEKSHIPFFDEPILYPDADTWRELTARRREKYSASELAKHGPAEKKIEDALKSPTRLEFIETPLQDIIDYLKDYHHIEIQLDKSALDELDINADTPVTKNLQNISLRSALRLLLHDLGLTYVVDNDELLITSPEAAVWTSRHAWSIAELLGRMQTGRRFEPCVYEPPRVREDAGAMLNLIACAPAMNTTAADVLAVLEAEMQSGETPKPGKIDDRARQLIEKARGAGWQSATFADKSGKPVLSIEFDGTGRYRYQRAAASGLREEVLCDGANLWHLYPELGIGARRAVHRPHREQFARRVPWAVPPVEDLARGADLVSLDEQTVAVVPRGVAKLKDKDGKPLPYLRLHLVFAADGRLAQRRLVEMPGGKTLFTLNCSDGGNLEWKDEASGKKTSATVILRPCGAPDLKPDARLVVLPLPLRSRDHLRQARKMPDNDAYANWGEDEALAALAGDLSLNPAEAKRILVERFFNRNDRRLGLYTLLLSTGHVWNTKEKQKFDNGMELQLDPVADHPHEPLARYIEGGTSIRLKTRKEFGDLGGPRDGFLRELAEFHDLRFRLTAATDAERLRHLDPALAFAGRCHCLELGWAVLDAARQKCREAKSQQRVAEAAKRFEDVPGLWYAARYERARALSAAGQWQEAQDSFARLYEEMLKLGIVPPVDGSFRDALRGTEGGNKRWQKLFLDGAKKFVEAGDRPTAVRMAWQLDRLGDQALAEEVLGLALRGVPEEQRTLVTLAAAEYLWNTDRHVRLDALLEPLLADKGLARWPSLWRLAAAVAEKRGMTARSASSLERAMEIEYENLPEKINVEVLRKDYGELLDRYAKLAAAMATLQSEPPRELVTRVVRAADRWRQLDTDPTAACQAAAKILGDLGAADLAWDYLTSPLAARPNEAAPWIDLAKTLRQQAHFSLADRAYASAFRAEPTNAQILWDRAQALLENGRGDEARKLFRQIAEGEWDPRFNGLRQQAKEMQ